MEELNQNIPALGEVETLKEQKKDAILATVAYGTALLSMLPYISLILLMPLHEIIDDISEYWMQVPTFIAGIVISIIGIICARKIRETLPIVINIFAIILNLITLWLSSLQGWVAVGGLFIFAGIGGLMLVTLTIISLIKIPVSRIILEDKDREPIETVQLWAHGTMLILQAVMVAILAVGFFTPIF